MPTNRTDNYALSQWERSDRIQMEDFNADNAKIDAALHNLEERVSLLYRAVPNLAYYLGALGAHDLLANRKYLPQRCMRNECFLFPQYLTLSGGATLKDGVLTVPGGGQTGRCVVDPTSLEEKRWTQARLWLHHTSRNPSVFLNGQPMTPVGSFIITGSASGEMCQEQEFLLENGDPSQNAEITLEWKSANSDPAKIFDYSVFFF